MSWPRCFALVVATFSLSLLAAYGVGPLRADEPAADAAGRPRATFKVRAHDGIDEIGAGTHERCIVTWDRFKKGVSGKRAKAEACA